MRAVTAFVHYTERYELWGQRLASRLQPFVTGYHATWNCKLYIPTFRGTT